MSEAGGIDLLLLLFLVTAQAIRETNGNRTVIEAVIHIEVLFTIRLSDRAVKS